MSHPVENTTRLMKSCNHPERNHGIVLIPVSNVVLAWLQESIVGCRHRLGHFPIRFIFHNFKQVKRNVWSSLYILFSIFSTAENEMNWKIVYAVSLAILTYVLRWCWWQVGNTTEHRHVKNRSKPSGKKRLVWAVNVFSVFSSSCVEKPWWTHWF